MELLALALVNVVTAGLMYVFFSIRFSRAVRQTVEQSRKNSLIRELKENVELTIEYINSSLDTMDQKTRSFYQLLRRSEELATRLESLHQAPDSGPDSDSESAATRARRAKKATAATGSKKKQSAKRGAGKAASSPAAKKTAAKKSRNARSALPAAGDASSSFRGPAGIDDEASTELEPESSTAYNVDRILEDMGDDRLDISEAPRDVESAYRGGERSRGFVPEAKAELSATPLQDDGGVFGRIGAITRRILGIDALPAAPAPAPLRATGDASNAAADPGPAARFSVPELSPEELARPVPGARPRLNPVNPARNESHDDEQTESGAVLPRLDRLELSGGERPAQADRLPDVALNAGPGRVTGAGYGPAFSAQPELPPPSEILAARGLSDAVHEGEARRAEVIRALLSYGYRTGDISRATGIGLPEIELVASLPASGRRPRRTRLSESNPAGPEAAARFGASSD